LRKFVVAVIGAGMGGLNAAVQLKHAGIPYFVIEKNDEVGGLGMKTSTLAPGLIPQAVLTHISMALISNIRMRSACSVKT
jgi:cation diffusion facilitator CzcD-associated flavoprotein CzcO